MSDDTEVRLAPPSPINGNRLPLGKHPHATGGKAGRSGRKRDEFKARLEKIRDAKGLSTVEEILNGQVTYTLNAVCEHCGNVSKGPEIDDVVKLIPTPDARLRAVDLSMKYTVGTAKTVRIEGGLHGTQAALDLIRERIQALLSPNDAKRLIEDIQDALRTQLSRRL